MITSLLQRWVNFYPILRSIPWTLKLLWQSHPQSMIIISVLTLLQGAVPVGQLWITKLLIDQIAHVITVAPNARTEQMVTLVFLYLGLEALILFAGILIGALSGHFYNILSEHLSYYVQMRILDRCACLDLAAYESPMYYNQLQQARDQAGQGPVQILRRLLEMTQNLVSLLSVTALVFLYNPWIVLIPIITTIPGFFIAIHYGRQRFFLYDSRTPLGRRAAYIEHILSADEYAKEVRVWGLAGYLMTLLQSLRQRFRQENIDLSRRQSTMSLLGELCSTCGYYSSYIVIILGVMAGNLTIGDLTLYAGAFSRSQSLFENLLQAIANMYGVQLFAQRLEAFLNLKPQIVAPPDPHPPVPDKSITIDNLSFVYPETGEKVLDGLNLTIRPGECVAVVGANGAGKTTLVKLLLRLYDPSDGHIYVGGTDIREMDPAQLRRGIAVVFQDYAHYQMTIRENIGFGNIDEIANLERIQQVARETGIDTIIDNLPDSYETVLGRLFEGGCELSLGQWQRIAVARALLRDAPILIMDEPTAAMDAQSEYDLYQQLKKLAQSRMTILISHRFSTVRMADRIFVLEDGKVIEEGTHAELLERDTRYAYYFNLQAESYQTTPATARWLHDEYDERLPGATCI